MGTSETLRAVIEAGRSSKRLDELSTARVIQKVAELVHAAQQKAGAGKPIGPITPAGITLTEDGEIKLGLAEPGAHAYSSPEQLAGGGDRRSDVFSLGVVMWEALTHQRLFDAITDEAMKAAVAGREIKPPAEFNANIPAELSAICMKALARSSTERYQSTKVMGVEIEEVLGEAGYADSNDQIAAFIADLAKAKHKPPAPGLPSVLGKPPAVAPTTATSTMIGATPAMLVPPASMTPAPPVLPDKPPGATVPANSPPAMTLIGTPPGATVAAATPAAPLSTFAPLANGAEHAHAHAPAPAPAPEEAPNAAASPEGSSPHPAAVVSLPMPSGEGRESQKLLAGWAWQTDSVQAITDDDDYEMPSSNRKSLLYMIGGGIAVAGIVTVIMVAFGGHSDKKPAPAATSQAPAAVAATEPAPVPAPAVTAPGSSAPAPIDPYADTKGSDTGSAVPDTGSAAPAPGSAAPDTGSAAPDTAKPDTTKPDTTKPDTAPPPDTTKPKPDATKPKPDKVVKDTPKPDKRPDKPRQDRPRTVARADVPKADKPPKPDKNATAPKVEVETAYRIGLQQFARGDTTGALASLRTSLAGNPNFPPTWRALGLVFEKMGEKDQARAAYKRYLQLSPSAADGDQIRGRLERL